MLLYGNRLSTSATVVRSSFLSDNDLLFCEDKDFITVEDYDLWLHLALNKARFKFINVIAGEYTIHAHNSINKQELHLNNLKSLLKYHCFELSKHGLNNKIVWMQTETLFAVKKSIKTKNFIILKSIFFAHPIFVLKIFFIQFLKKYG